MLNIMAAIILSIIVMMISIGTGVFLERYKASITEMLGMMIGMTLGMMTGIAVGYFMGAATDMFISNLIGVIIGVLFGVIFGRIGRLMGMMDGGMGGMMGGMMGAMLGLMLQNLYEGWAVSITSILIMTLYLLSMIALVRLVQKSGTVTLEIDLVCGMEVDPKTSLQYVYKGKTYFFCAPSCQRAFSKNPEEYIREK
jgi:YHS domain-containing protein